MPLIINFLAIFSHFLPKKIDFLKKFSLIILFSHGGRKLKKRSLEEHALMANAICQILQETMTGSDSVGGKLILPSPKLAISC